VQRDEVVTGHVSIGLIASVTESVLADSLSRFHARYPHVEVTVADGYSATLIDWGRGRPARCGADQQAARASLARFAAAPRRGNGARHQHRARPGSSARDRACAVARTRTRAATKRHGLRGVLDTAAQHEMCCSRRAFEIDVLSTIVKLVETTRFATILPRIVVERAGAAGHLARLSDPRAAHRAPHRALSHPRRPLSAREALIAIIADELRQVRACRT